MEGIIVFQSERWHLVTERRSTCQSHNSTWQKWMSDLLEQTTQPEGRAWNRTNHKFSSRRWDTAASQLHHIFFKAASILPRRLCGLVPVQQLRKCTFFCLTFLEFLRWCWSSCHVDLLFNFSGVFSISVSELLASRYLAWRVCELLLCLFVVM